MNIKVFLLEKYFLQFFIHHLWELLLLIHTNFFSYFNCCVAGYHTMTSYFIHSSFCCCYVQLCAHTIVHRCNNLFYIIYLDGKLLGHVMQFSVSLETARLPHKVAILMNMLAIRIWEFQRYHILSKPWLTL